MRSQKLPPARRMQVARKSLRGILVLAAALFAVATAQLAAEQAAETESGDAEIAIVGTQACSLCEFGVGKECCLGILADDMKFVVEGPACDKLFDNRHSGDKTYVVGKLFIKNDAMYLEGKTIEAPSDPPPPAVATGTLRDSEAGPVLVSGKTTIHVAGKAAAQARAWLGQRVRVEGKLLLSEGGRVTLEAIALTRAPEAA